VAQKYAFQSYSTEDGLPQTQVNSFCQDDAGYLWVGTLGGLSKFNGEEFKTITPKDGLLNNRIQTLYNDSGRIWVGHDGGVSCIENNKIENFEFIGKGRSRSVSKILRFKDMVIVCSTRGGGLFEIVDDRLRQVTLPTEDAKAIRSAIVSGQYLYLATKGGILKTTDLKTFTLEKGVAEGSYTGVEANDDEIYFISFRNGVYQKELKTGETRHIPSEEAGNYLLGGKMDAKGTLWLFNKDGIITISNNKIIHFGNEVSGLPVNNSVQCIFDDSFGNIWIGSNGKGMFRFPGEKFRYYDRSTGYFSDFMLNGFESKDGSLYFGSLDAGVIKRSPNGDKSLIDVNHSTVWASQLDVDGLNWFGTSSELVSIDDNDQVVTIYNEEDGLPGRKITSFYKVGSCEMYIGGSEGVSHYKDGVILNLQYGGMPDIGTVRDFVMIDEILTFSSNLGLFQYKNGEFIMYRGIDATSYNIEKDESGNVWFGTEEGLFQIRNNKVTRVELRNDPGSNFINFINYRDGELYVGSNNGLFLLSNLDSTEPKIKRFGISEGVVDLETNLNSGFFDRDGNFWFGTAAGLVCFRTDVDGVKMGIPRLEVKSILLNYQEFNYENYSEIDASGFPKHLSLPSSKNNLIFELDGVSLSNHRGLNYQFLLEGLNDSWSPLTSNSTITFTNLPAGEYLLRMRTVDIDGRTSKEIVVPFTIQPAFYKTWWFITLCILGIGGLVVLFFRFRVRRINSANEKEKLEFKSRLLSLEQQSMNASMNRHFVFNSLNSIQYFINTQDRLSANKYLTNFAKLIRKNLDTATVDGNMISLEEELERLELYLSLESMRFKDRFDYKISATGVDTNSILIPAMILQPFIENSIIHGILPNLKKKGFISLEVREENGYLLMSVEDNGVGVNQSMTKKGDTEGDHRSKGMEITSKRIELIQKISNNDISLVGPYEVYNDDRSIKGTHVLLKIPLNNLEN
jgi:ligand-binding sensor domain-containing protein